MEATSMQTPLLDAKLSSEIWYKHAIIFVYFSSGGNKTLMFPAKLSLLIAITVSVSTLIQLHIEAHELHDINRLCN